MKIPKKVSFFEKSLAIFELLHYNEYIPNMAALMKEVFMIKQSNYNVGIYIRLSQEDMRSGESLSIENQRKMLTEYVSRQQGWNLVDIYVDM